ncbi:MAG: hypothetical protein JF595_13515 [Sphingomonadales bacterium]|nr:hypothetical protein [Sphingomonadales bacterium]
MIDKTRTKPDKGTLPAFTPVPRQCQRHDGWTPERQQGFIEALADTGSVRAAAHAVNMTPEGAYYLRRQPGAEPFRKAWEAALRLGVERLEDVAMERALHGVEVPVYHFGAVVGTRRHYNDRLLMFMLRNRAKKRFSADGWQKEDAYTRGQLKKLKRQWQQEWQDEQERNAPSPDEVRASIEQKVEMMRQRVLARRAEELAAASPKTRQLHAAWQASVAEDARLRAQGLLPAPRSHAEPEDENEDEEEQDE